MHPHSALNFERCLTYTLITLRDIFLQDGDDAASTAFMNFGDTFCPAHEAALHLVSRFPLAGWFTMENPKQIRMIGGYPYDLGKLQMWFSRHLSQVKSTTSTEAIRSAASAGQQETNWSAVQMPIQDLAYPLISIWESKMATNSRWWFKILGPLQFPWENVHRL